MVIRYGYEITLTRTQPTALVCLLSVHESRAADIEVPEATYGTGCKLPAAYRPSEPEID